MSDLGSQLAAAPLTLAGPLYNQIKKLLRARVQAGEWSDGRAMPNEAELARQYGVSLGTMRKALEHLGREKLIVRRQGRGTFVESNLEARHSPKSALHLNFDRRGRLNDSMKVADLTKEIVAPTDQEATALEISRLSKAARVRVLATWQDGTASIDTFTIPLSTFQNHHVEADLTKLNFLSVIQQLEPNVSRYVDTIALGAAYSEAARLLSIREGQPLVEITRVATDRTARPLFLLNRQVKLFSPIEYVSDLS